MTLIIQSSHQLGMFHVYTSHTSTPVSSVDVVTWLEAGRLGFEYRRGWRYLPGCW